MTRRATVLDALEPEAVASLNPFQLRTMGLEPGDMVKVATRRGEIALNVRADRDVPEGMVFIPFCFNAAAANMLSNPTLDHFVKNPELRAQSSRVRTECGSPASSRCSPYL